MVNSNMQSLANQLGWCITTKDYLIELENELRFVANKYQNIVDELKNRGYLADLLYQIEVMNKEFQETSSDLIKHIENEHLAYIERQSVSIRGSLDRILGS
jgi:hypothetical protein